MNPSSTPASTDSRLGLDTLLRRELKVGDPNDPEQLARALMERYQDNRRAQAIDGEARGLPFLQTPIVRNADVVVQTPLELDLDLARSRVRADLDELMTESLTATIRPELEGWRNAITTAIHEGVAAARIALDPGRRDVAFAMRRRLGEYARLARLVGLFSPALRAQYRSLATSLDDAASVMLVLAGEAIANVGLSGGRFLLQTSYSELQARRDAVLSALRRIDGIAVLNTSDGASHWPRGLRAHRQMNLLFEARGQGELRSLLNEAELARTLDELVQQASGGTPQGLRSIGSTSWGPLNRLRRFTRTAAGLTEPASHELAGLIEALRLFIDGFQPAGGFRLLRVARPAIVSQSAGALPPESAADRRLRELTTLRGRLAMAIDAWQACRCEVADLQGQAALDRVLFGLDRAIDDYANGSAELGLCEVRASALHLLVRAMLENEWAVAGDNHDFWNGAAPPWVMRLRAANIGLARLLELLVPSAAAPEHEWPNGSLANYDTAFVQNLVIAGEGAPHPHFAQVLHDELADVLDNDRQWLPVVQQLATHGALIDAVLGEGQGLVPWQERALEFVEDVSGVPAAANLPNIEVPQHFEVSLQQLAN